MPRPTFEMPRVIGEVDAAFMEELQDLYPDAETGTEWHRHPGRHKPAYDMQLLRALQPLQKMITGQAVGHRFRGPSSIHYLVDNRGVPPGTAQRPPSWHIDGRGDRRRRVKSYGSLIVASAIPTEFIVGLNRFAARPDIPRDMAQAEIEALGLSIYQPAPFEIVLMGEHYHRSPSNETGTKIERTWIRAALLRY